MVLSLAVGRICRTRKGKPSGMLVSFDMPIPFGNSVSTCLLISPSASPEYKQTYLVSSTPGNHPFQLLVVSPFLEQHIWHIGYVPSWSINRWSEPRCWSQDATSRVGLLVDYEVAVEVSQFLFGHRTEAL